MLAKGELLESQHQWEEAALHWSRLAREGAGALFLVRASAAAIEAGLRAQADALLREAIVLEPHSEEAWFSLGLLLEEEGHLEESRRLLEHGLELEERQPVLTILGSVQRRLGDAKGAEVTLRRSLALNPNDDEAHYGLGLVLLASDPVKAVHHLRSALKIDPELPHAQREFGHALWKAGRLDESETAFLRAVEQNPADAWAHSYLGHVMGLRNDWLAARKEFSQAVALEPGCGFFWANLADAHLSLGYAEEAERCYIRGLAVEIDEPRVNARYGLYLYSKGQLSKARAYLRRAVELDPSQKRAREALEEIANDSVK